MFLLITHKPVFLPILYICNTGNIPPKRMFNPSGNPYAISKRVVFLETRKSALQKSKVDSCFTHAINKNIFYR